jgi:hypothetical protein
MRQATEQMQGSCTLVTQITVRPGDERNAGHADRGLKEQALLLPGTLLRLIGVLDVVHPGGGGLFLAFVALWSLAAASIIDETLACERGLHL